MERKDKTDKPMQTDKSTVPNKASGKYVKIYECYITDKFIHLTAFNEAELSCTITKFKNGRNKRKKRSFEAISKEKKFWK